MLNSDDIVFVSTEFDDEQSSKIARVLNAHEIKTTTDMNAATIIVEPVKKPQQQQQNNNLTVAILAKKIEENQEELIKLGELYNQMFTRVPHVEIPEIELSEPRKKKHKQNKFIQNQKLAKFNKIKYKHKQILFNRTRHK